MNAPAKVTLRPSDEVVQQSLLPCTVKDARGRLISLQKPGVLAQFRMIEMLGAQLAENQVYVGMVLPLMYIAEIDGEPVARMTTKRELEALIQRLDEDGIMAVAEGVEKNFGRPNPEADQAALKN
jgi:hypothetical protein